MKKVVLLFLITLLSSFDFPLKREVKQLLEETVINVHHNADDREKLLYLYGRSEAFFEIILLIEKWEIDQDGNN